MKCGPKRLAVLASGGGRSLENLCERIDAGDLDAVVELLIVDKESAGAKQRAERRGIPVVVVPKAADESPAVHSARIFEELDCTPGGPPDLVVLAGFLKLLQLPAEWIGRVLNIHPSLLPAFGGRGYYGLHVHRAVLERGVQVTGCTVHYVDDQYDHGRILLQRWIPVPGGIDAEALAALVFEEEKLALPAAIDKHFELQGAART